MITGPAADRLTGTFQRRIRQVGDRAARLAAARWDALGSYDEADVPRYAAQTRNTAAAAHAAAVVAGAGYYATLGQFRPPAVSPRDVPLELDPREPFIAHWNALQAHEPWEAAVLSGQARSMAVMRNLAVSSARRAGDVTLRKARQTVDGWERRTDAKPCPWCVGVAADVYGSAAAADFGHDRCGCSVVPLISAA